MLKAEVPRYYKKKIECLTTGQTIGYVGTSKIFIWHFLARLDKTSLFLADVF